MTHDSVSHHPKAPSVLDSKTAVGSRPGRPIDPSKDTAILIAARQSFLELPYDRVSMDSIAERAGVSKVTLYAKYKSKEGLFVAAMNESCHAIYNQARADIQVGEPIRTTLLRLGVRFMMMILDPEVAAMHAVMMQSSQICPELPKQFYDSSVDRSIETLAETLSIATQRGTIACAMPRQAAIQFIAMVQGVFRYQLELGVNSDVSEIEIRDYVEACVALFLRGYAVDG